MPPTTPFAVTFDYRCPFARNAHEHVLVALRARPDLDARFVPFSLGQVHVEEGQPDIWDRPADDSGLLALQVGVVVRDHHPDAFLDVHEDLFALRHDHARSLRDETALREVVARHGVDADAVFDEIAEGWPLDTVRKEHESAADAYDVWGVPTFIAGEQAVFVRLMDRPAGDTDLAVRTVERVVDLATGWPELNELKHTSIPR